MTFREKGTIDPAYPHALPFFSTNTEEEARGLQQLHCRKQYDGRFVLTHWDGNVEEVFELAERLDLEAALERMRHV